MTGKPPRQQTFKELRRRAEQIVEQQGKGNARIDSEELLHLIHEIDVYQVELELQNEELQAASRELQDSRDAYFDLFNSAPVGFLVLDNKGRIKKANAAAAQILGEDTAWLTGSFLSQYIYPGDQRTFFSWFRQKKDNADETDSLELRISGKAKNTHHVRLDARAVRDRDRHLKEWRFALTDMTARKQAEAKVLYLQKSESLNRMAGGVAHHFNNQLSVVLGSLELVLDDLPEDSQNREIISQAFDAARKAADQSTQMMRYLGHASENRATICLSDVCRQSLPFLQAATPSTVTLNVDLPDSGIFVQADAVQIQQILIHLFTNGHESLDDNQGTIGLSVKAVSHEEIPASNRFPMDWQPQEIPYACLEISDTGCGISGQNIKQIFDPFFSTKFTGRGMGLAVVTGILKTHRGCITVDSMPGRGSVFQVYLPMPEDTNSPS